MTLPAIALLVIVAREAAHPAVWAQAVAAGAGDLTTSAEVAILAAVVACLPAVAVSRSLIVRPRGLCWLVSVPLAMPSALAGVGLRKRDGIEFCHRRAAQAYSRYIKLERSN